MPNPNLVLATPGSLAKSQPYSFSAATHGGQQTLLFADKNANSIYALTGDFTAG
ncbi:MAG: hypothetical protein JO157_18420, partial [Acetobacteraceae bacterium]|nr:hypothetical protein [Acetobacteraceae bacterium]